MTDHHRQLAGPPPTARQQRYVRQLAMQRRISFVPPRTCFAASRVIDQLKRRRAHTMAERRRAVRATLAPRPRRVRAGSRLGRPPPCEWSGLRPLANGGPLLAGLGCQSEPVGVGGRLAAVGGAEFAQDVGDVDAGGADADVYAPGPLGLRLGLCALPWRVAAQDGAPHRQERRRLAGPFDDGETRTRTEDATIFNRGCEAL
jgi:hypothetical protein